MEQPLLFIMVFGYLILQMLWFLMDNRSINEKIKFYIFLKGNTCSRIIIIGLAGFLFVKYIDPNWKFSLSFYFHNINDLFLISGFVLYLSGIALCIWARSAMRNVWTPAEDKSIRHKKELITWGPFAFTRNPIYLGLLMIYSGLFISMKSYLIIIVLFIIRLFYKEALEEEKALEKDFGSDYLKFKSKVRRFI